MSLSELTRAYDHLLGILKQREKLIKKRIADSLTKYGKEERVLWESKNFRMEQETMPDLLRNIINHDDLAID
jgi:DNA-directed RNA polymerase subunit F